MPKHKLRGKVKLLSDSAYNETGKEDTPEQMDPHFNYEESHARHGTDEGACLGCSVNAESGAGIMGGPAPGEPDLPEHDHGKKSHKGRPV